MRRSRLAFTGMSLQQRKEPRFDYAGRVWCELDDIARYVAFKNVSASGAQLGTLLPLEVGVTPRMRWVFSGEEIAVKARVVWSRPNDEGTLAGLVFEAVETPIPLTKFIQGRENG
jgi:PilZ domain